MFSRHYQAELAFLRGMGREFAVAHPSVAGLLAERSGDPDVERLLEGFAFLAARVRERLDDSAPEVIEDLTELLVPHALRPVPACTVVEFLPLPGALRSRVQVPAGTELGAVPVEGVSCRFRTGAPLDLVPAAVVDASLDQSIGASPSLRVELQLGTGAAAAVLQDAPLRFFVHGELPFASGLILWIARHLRGARVRAPRSKREASLGPDAVRPIGFDPSFPLLDTPALAPRGFRLAQEYFALPQKLLFFEVSRLGAARELNEDRLELWLDFDRPPPLSSRVTPESLRLNCAPVVNLFPAAGEPLRVEVVGEEHVVRVAGLAVRHAEVHAIERVLGQPAPGGAARPYQPFSSFSHGRDGAAGRYYRVRRRAAMLDGGVDLHLAVLTPRDGAPGPLGDVLSLDLTCSNRMLPARLGIGDVSVATRTSPTVARFRNLVPVSRPARPPLGTDLHWRLLASLAAHRRPVSADLLRRQLDLFEYAGASEQGDARANRLRIDGIVAAEGRPSRRVLDGAMIRGQRIALELEEASFAGPGDAFLFGGVLDELFAAQAPLNAFNELTAKLRPSAREFTWPPRNGNQVLR